MRNKSMVWNFFEKIEQNGQKWVLCTICKNHYRNFGSTSNMIQHLTKRHANDVLLSEVQEGPSQIKEQVEQDLETNDLSDLITFETETHQDTLPRSPTPPPPKRIFVKPSQKFLKKRYLNHSSSNHSPFYTPYKAASTTHQKVDNEFELFARYMVSQLQVLPLEEALTAQEAIQSIITRARLRTLKKEKEEVTVMGEVSGVGCHQVFSEGHAQIVSCNSEAKENGDQTGQSVV